VLRRSTDVRYSGPSRESLEDTLVSSVNATRLPGRESLKSSERFTSATLALVSEEVADSLVDTDVSLVVTDAPLVVTGVSLVA
jgi:hypothetical protein